MLPWHHLGSATTPEGEALRLMRRGDEFSIRLDRGRELMNSRLSGSEEALATLAVEHLAGRQAPRLLIGGLGMGFTLRAAQAAAPPDARLTVVEIVPELVTWAAGPMAPLFGDSLSDPRVEVRVCDVAEVVREAAGGYDAILLDVDNGPEAFTRPGNDALYAERGLSEARRALASGGMLAVWSAAPDPGFTRRLRSCGFDARTVQVRAARGKRGARHTIWLAFPAPGRWWRGTLAGRPGQAAAVGTRGLLPLSALGRSAAVIAATGLVAPRLGAAGARPCLARWREAL
jgi:spermidine synthase